MYLWFLLSGSFIFFFSLDTQEILYFCKNFLEAGLLTNINAHQQFMLSRRHLRIKVLQALYAFKQSNNDNLSQGGKAIDYQY